MALAQGGCFGAGADIVAACGTAVAAADAKFRMPGWKFGLALGTRRLAVRVGAAEAFGGLEASVVANPTNALQKSAKYVKESADAVWAGATVWNYTDPAGPTFAVNPTIGFSQGTKIQMAVYAEAAGLCMMAKVEDAQNAGINKESGCVMTTKAGWQTMVFDFTGVDLAKTYNRLSLFPRFLEDPLGVPVSTTYFDNIVYPSGVIQKPKPPCNTGGKIILVDGKYASDYSGTGTGECGSYGDYSGEPTDPRWWGGYANNGDAGGHPSMYFGYGVSPTSWGVGGYVKAPKNGFVPISATTNNMKGVTFELWGNDELLSALQAKSPKGTLHVTMKARPNVPLACTASISTDVTPMNNGVSSYSKALSSFTLDLPACGALNTVAKVLASGIAEFHAQAIAPNLYRPNNTDQFPNGLNIGKITFTP
jgi:hypothetical protein